MIYTFKTKSFENFRIFSLTLQWLLGAVDGQNLTLIGEYSSAVKKISENAQQYAVTSSLKC
jgi:hypothetical protein